MSSSWKGALVGACNVFVVALLVASVAPELRAQERIQLMILIGLVGSMPGLFVGAAAGWIGGRLPVFRRLALTAFTCGGVIVFGMLSLPEFIGIAIVPTLIHTLVLERWTRSNLIEHERPAPLSPASIGLIVGATNVIVVAAVLGFYVAATPHGYQRYLLVGREVVGFQIAAIVTALGLLPGCVLGAGIGWLAGHLDDQHQLIRIGALGSLAALGVVVLGAMIDQRELIVPALVPTLILTAVLERFTRGTPALPMARTLA